MCDGQVSVSPSADDMSSSSSEQPQVVPRKDFPRRLVTLETFIIDTFTRAGEDDVEAPFGENQIGGGGTYAILGSRVFLPPNRLGMIVDYTPDTLPSSMRKRLEDFGAEMWYFRQRTDGYGTTMAVNRYKADLRIFEYLTPARYLFPSDILSSPWTNPPPTTIHMISDSQRLASFEDEMKKMRVAFGEDWDPLFIWEPEPYDNIPQNLDMFASLGPQMDIISPNHTEALTLFSLGPPPSSLTGFKPLLQVAMRRLLALRPRLGVIIRAGQYGACYASSCSSPGRAGRRLRGRATHSDEDVGALPIRWVPAFYDPESSESKRKVVDPTGAGNGFMGAVAAALDEGKAFDEAILWGTVAASFMIEQDGLPSIETINGEERWNGESPWFRVEKLRQRLQQ